MRTPRLLPTPRRLPVGTPGGPERGLTQRVTSRLPLVGWLTVVWTGLWGSVTAANVLGGLAVAVGLLVLVPLPATPSSGAVRLLPTLRLLGVFAVDLLKANVVVAAQVLRASTPRGRPLRRAIIACPMRTHSDRLTTMVANLVSLTPGTLTVEIDRYEAVIYVHVLDLETPEALRADVSELEARVILALGSAEAAATLAGTPGTVPDRHQAPRAAAAAARDEGQGSR